MFENRVVEFKEKLTPNFLKVVSAYANYGTGKIIFGVSDDGRQKGIGNMEETKTAIEDMINGNLKPLPFFSIEEEQGKIILTVQKGEYTPYLYKGKAYRRSDTSSVEVDETELKRLILEGKNLNFEEVRSREQELTFQYLELQLMERLGIEKLNKDILRTLQLYSDRNGYNLAAYLLSDNLEGVGLDIVKFGVSIDIIEKRAAFLSKSVVKQFEDAISLFKEYYIVEKIEGEKRIPAERIPLVAFREALANAIVHRQWDVNANIQISMYADRIEIVSPGGLPSQISKEEYLNGQFPILRNPILADVFFKLGIIEKFGTGIKRIRLAYRDVLAAPGFELYDNSIRITLPVTSDVNCSADERKVFDYIVSQKVAGSRELAEITGYEKSKVLRILHSLEEKKLIVSEGKGRSVRYRKPDIV